MTLIRTVTINGKPVIGYAYEAPTTLEQAITLIHLERDFRRRAGGYKAAGKWFHSDIESKIEQLGLDKLGPMIPPGLAWKTMDGTMAPMTATLAAAVFAAGVTKSVALFEASEQHIAAVTASGDFAGHDYFSGWPTSYWED